jgi:hypothetical protein
VPAEKASSPDALIIENNLMPGRDMDQDVHSSFNIIEQPE